jgi:hypothetical protein
MAKGIRKKIQRQWYKAKDRSKLKGKEEKGERNKTELITF